MIFSKTTLGSELDKIKQLVIENGYPADVPLSCINQNLANFAAERAFGSEKCPVYKIKQLVIENGYPADVPLSCINQNLPWIGKVSSKFENQINKAIASCFYAVKPRVAVQH